MNEINENEQQLIDVINTVLDRLHSNNLFHNPIFKVEDFGLAKRFVSNKIDSIHLVFLVHQNAIEIMIDRISEPYSWDYDDIMENKNLIMNVIEEFLTCSYQVDYYGKNKTILNLTDSFGNSVRTYKDYFGIFCFKRKITETKKYLPLITRL